MVSGEPAGQFSGLSGGECRDGGSAVVELTHNLRPRNLPPRVVNRLDLLQTGVTQTCRQLDTCQRHGGRRLLHRREGSV